MIIVIFPPELLSSLANPAAFVTSPHGLVTVVRAGISTGWGVGVRMNKRALVWPHGHRVAVVCSVLLETWSDGKSPSYFPRTTPLPPGSKDVAGINWSRFGGNEGIWRLSRDQIGRASCRER